MDQQAELNDERTSGGQADKALDILEWVAERESSNPKLTEITAGLGLPKATVHRLLTLLKQRGYVEQDAQSGYSLGLKCFELGEHWSRRFDLRALARPYLERLNRELEETVQLAIYDQGDAVYIDKLESPQQVLARPDPSSRAPATVVATGRALLAFQSPAEIELQLARPLPKYTEDTPAGPDQVAEILDEVRVNGYAVNRETYRGGICGLAAPIRNSTGAVVASIGIIVPAHRFVDGNMERYREVVTRTAVDISAAMGGPSQLITSSRRGTLTARK
jgi:DNA-binding IclR family transcriptional regulator